MSVLEIVLIIELVLLAAIAIVLLVALVGRDKQASDNYVCGNPDADRTCVYAQNPNARAYRAPVNGKVLSYPVSPRTASSGMLSPEEPSYYVRSVRGGYSRGVSERAESSRSAYAKDPYFQAGSYGSTYSADTLPRSASRNNAASWQGSADAVYRGGKKTIITPGLADQTVIRPSEAPRSGKLHSKVPGSGNLLSKRPRWRVDFMEMSSGRHVSRDFRDHLVVGRMMNSPMESGRLYLSMDATVSRSQFCLYVTEDGVMLENLSNVNITRKNGYPVWQPVRLEEGDILQLGRMRYMVKGIRPAA